MWLMKAECYGKIDVYRNEYDQRDVLDITERNKSAELRKILGSGYGNELLHDQEKDKVNWDR